MRQSGGVHPAYRGRGIGSALLDWAQRAAVPIHAELHAGQPLSLGGRCLARLDDAIERRAPRAERGIPRPLGSAEQTEESWAHFIGYHAFRSSYSFLACAGAEPLGVVLGHEYEEPRVGGRRDLYIPLVGTRRAGRRRGIASALVTRALRTARADGFDTATLDVDADSATGVEPVRADRLRRPRHVDRPHQAADRLTRPPTA